MTNFLDNGSVLPHGLLGISAKSSVGAFNKTYKNTSLRMGIITAIYPFDDDNNHSGLTTEYDVVVFEQNEDRGATTQLYKNCMAAEGLGSIADFLEMNRRPLLEKTSSGQGINTTGQDGAIVLLLCMDGNSDKGVIVGSITHPDRPTNLMSNKPYLEGEYNGLNVVINNDGSTTLTFKGATDNKGVPIDSTQATTTVKIEKDGTFQINNETVTLRLDRTVGTATLKAKTNVDVTVDEGDITATATKGNITCTAKGNITASAEGNLAATAKGNITADAEGNLVATAKGDITMDGSGGKLKLSGAKVAIGAGDELLDLLEQTLTKMIKLTMDLSTEAPAGFGSPLIFAADYAALNVDFTTIKGKLDGIKGSL